MTFQPGCSAAVFLADGGTHAKSVRRWWHILVFGMVLWGIIGPGVGFPASAQVSATPTIVAGLQRPAVSIDAQEDIDAWLAVHSDELAGQLVQEVAGASPGRPSESSKPIVGNPVQAQVWNDEFLNGTRVTIPLVDTEMWLVPVIYQAGALGVIELTLNKQGEVTGTINNDADLGQYAQTFTTSGHLVFDTKVKGWFSLQDDVVTAIDEQAKEYLAGPLLLEEYVPFLQERFKIKPKDASEITTGGTRTGLVDEQAKETPIEGFSTLIFAAILVMMLITAVIFLWRSHAWHEVAPLKIPDLADVENGAAEESSGDPGSGQAEPFPTTLPEGIMITEPASSTGAIPIFTEIDKPKTYHWWVRRLGKNERKPRFKMRKKGNE